VDVWWISTGFPQDFHWIHWMWWLSVVDGKLQLVWSIWECFNQLPKLIKHSVVVASIIAGDAEDLSEEIW